MPQNPEHRNPRLIPEWLLSIFNALRFGILNRKHHSVNKEMHKNGDGEQDNKQDIIAQLRRSGLQFGQTKGPLWKPGDRNVV